MGKTKTQTTAQTLDPASQGYVNGQRAFGQEAADYARDNAGSFFLGAPRMTPGQMAQPFMNPYMDNVIGGVRGEFDHLRGQARLDTNEAATRAGAFNSDRHGVAEGVRMGELDRAQASQVGGLLHTGYQNALQQGTQFAEYKRALDERRAQAGLYGRQQGMGFLNTGMGPTGMTQTNTEKGSALGTLAGLGMTAASFFGGPTAAAGGSGFNPGAQPGVGFRPYGQPGPHPFFSGAR